MSIFERFAVNLANVTLGMAIMTETNMIHKAIAIDKTLVFHKFFLLRLKANLDDIKRGYCIIQIQRLQSAKEETKIK